MTAPTFAEAIGAGHDLYWWHQAILRELERIGQVTGRAAYNVPGIAGNLRILRMDAERYARDLINAGLVRPCEQLWDFDATWIELAA